jgi:GT2 family glycosyltransferase
MAAPEISVVIPTFRRPRELTAAIESVLAQGVPVEVVVVDDSPEQSARETVAHLGAPQVTYLTMPVPTGGRPAAVRNHGWPKTSAPVLHFLDDDDLVPEGHYREGLATLAARTDVGAVFGRVVPFGHEASLEHENRFFADAARRARRAMRFGPRLGFAAELLFNLPLLVGSASLVRRPVVEAIGGFDTGAELKYCEDVDYHCRAFRHGGATWVDRITLHYRITPTSLMHANGVGEAVNASYRHMRTRYEATHGRADLLALKLFARTVLA